MTGLIKSVYQGNGPGEAGTSRGPTQEADAPMSGKRTPNLPPETTVCPRCGRKTVKKRDGIFGWRICPATKSCGWTVFNHGDDSRDKEKS